MAAMEPGIISIAIIYLSSPKSPRSPSNEMSCIGLGESGITTIQVYFSLCLFILMYLILHIRCTAISAENVEQKVIPFNNFMIIHFKVIVVMIIIIIMIMHE